MGDREGGFWTSSFDREYGCEWLHYKIYKPYAHVYKGYLFEIKSDTKIFYIDSQESEEFFIKYFKEDYNVLAENYDCIHIEGSYVEFLRRTRSNSHFLHWTCDCTWWFNINKLHLIKIYEGDEINKFAKTPFKNSYRKKLL